MIDLPEAVYANSHSIHLSDSYTHIRTIDVVDLFRERGWEVSSARGPNPKRSTSTLFARHLVKMRKPNLGALPDNTIPEIVILNAHNGSWALKVLLGMFRMVCSNGMIIGEIFESAKLRHYKLDDVDSQIQAITNTMNERCEYLHKLITEWQERQLPLAYQLEFAERALAIRWKNHLPISGETLLKPQRVEDAGDSLWKVFNRIQENLMQGGFHGTTSNNRTMLIGRVTNVKRDVEFNTRLFNLAMEYA